MCRYRYYSAHKTPQFHLKVVSCWNTLAASKLWSRLGRQHRPGSPSAHHIPLWWGMAANLHLLHKPVPIIETLNGSPLKGGGLFLSWVVIFQGDLIQGKNDCRIILIRLLFRRNKKLAVLTFCTGVFINQNTFLCFFYMWQKGRDRERMKQCWKRPLFSFPLKAAFFSSPTHFFPEPHPLQKLTWPCVFHVTCLPKGLFQINSSTPWDASPPSLRAFQRHHLLVGCALF